MRLFKMLRCLFVAAVLFAGGVGLPFAWHAASAGPSPAPQVSDPRASAPDVSGPQGSTQAAPPETAPFSDSDNVYRVRIENRTRRGGKVEFVGYPESLIPLDGSSVAEVEARTSTVTVLVSTVDQGSCWVYVTTNGVLEVAGDGHRPECRFIPDSSGT